LVNLKYILEIAKTRYLDNMDKTRTDNYPRYRLLDKVWLKKPENYDALPFYKLTTKKVWTIQSNRCRRRKEELQIGY